MLHSFCFAYPAVQVCWRVDRELCLFWAAISLWHICWIDWMVFDALFLVVSLLVLYCTHQHLECFLNRCTTTFVTGYRSQHQVIGPTSKRRGANLYNFNWHCTLENKRRNVHGKSKSNYICNYVLGFHIYTQISFTWHRYINIHVRKYHLHL